jgi:ATP-dependent DNA ligase
MSDVHDSDKDAPLELPPLALAPRPPLDSPPPSIGDHRWVYQSEVPGEHVVVHINGALSGLGLMPAVRIENALGRDLSQQFPELDAMVALGHAGPISLHGVLRVVDRRTSSPDVGPSKSVIDRGDLAYRLAAADRSDALVRALHSPVELVVLDLMHLDGRRVADQPYAARRFLLAARVQRGPSWSVRIDHLDPGPALLDGELDGGQVPVLLSRRLDSRYFAAMTSRAWLRSPYPVVRRTPVVGWVDDLGSEGIRTDAVLVAAEAHHRGRRRVQPIRMGLTMELRGRLAECLEQLPTSGTPSQFLSDRDEDPHRARRRWAKPGTSVTFAATSLTTERAVEHPVLLEVHHPR